MTDFFKSSDCDISGVKFDDQAGTYMVGVSAITLAKANRLLAERGLLLAGSYGPSGGLVVSETNVSNGNPNNTHRCLAINIEPIEPDSAESLLREAANYLARSYPLMSHPDDEKYRADIAKRAKKLLGDVK